MYSSLFQDLRNFFWRLWHNGRWLVAGFTTVVHLFAGAVILALRDRWQEFTLEVWDCVRN